MKRLCTYNGCNEIVEVTDTFRGSPRCEKHQRTPPAKKTHHQHHYINGKNLYKTQRWVNLRKQYVLLQPLCEHCLGFGITKAGKIVDHIIEIEDGGAPFDIKNLQHLCHSCHNIKTGKEARKRNRKKKNGGFGSLSDF